MDNLQLIIHDIAMTPKNTISIAVQDKTLEALLDMNRFVWILLTC